jgi:predicted ATP-grasp superfamily ATP-dependent carboligase
MRMAIAADFACLPGRPVRVTVTRDARLPDDPGPWTTELINAGDGPGRVRDLARAADFTVLIAPETSGILAMLIRDYESAGARLLGSTAEAVELTADKSRLAARLRELSIDTPATRTIVPAAGLPEGAGYPAVLKPVDGAGSVDTFYLANAQSLPDRARKMPVALLQPFVPGTPMSASFLVGRGGQSWLVGVGSQRMAIRDGQFAYQGGTLPIQCSDAVPQLTRTVDAVAGLRGFVGVDFIWNADERRTTVLEINPRPTTSYCALCRVLTAGVLANAWLLACGLVDGGSGLLASLAQSVERHHRQLSFSAKGEIVSDDIGGAMS